MNKIGFTAQHESEEPAEEKIIEIPQKDISEMSVVEVMKSEKYGKKYAKATTEVLKNVCYIGNSVLMGSVWALCTSFPIVGIPLKICAGVSCVAIRNWITDKTDEACEKAHTLANEIIDSLPDE